MSGTEKISKGWKTLFVKFNKLWFSSHLSVCRVCVWCDVMSRDHKKKSSFTTFENLPTAFTSSRFFDSSDKNSVREIFREKTRIKKYLLKEWSRNFDLFCWRITWNWPTSLFLVFWFQNLIRQCTVCAVQNEGEDFVLKIWNVVSSQSSFTRSNCLILLK